jgi:hypothetical protein
MRSISQEELERVNDHLGKIKDPRRTEYGNIRHTEATERQQRY